MSVTFSLLDDFFGFHGLRHSEFKGHVVIGFDGLLHRTVLLACSIAVLEFRRPA